MRKNIWILSLTPITDEPRVIRQAKAFIDNGYNVILFGFPGRANKYPQTILFEIRRENIVRFNLVSDELKPRIFRPESQLPLSGRIISYVSVASRFLPRSVENIYIRFLNRISARLNFLTFYYLLRSRWNNDSALNYYWSKPIFRHLFETMSQVMKSYEDLKPDLIIGHDFQTAPIVSMLAHEKNIPFSINIHEYATQQYMHRWFWRIFTRVWVHKMQSIFLPKSALNTVICDGIADLLKIDYPNIERPTVIRSVPNFSKQPLRPCGQRIKVIYHGIIYKTRGLEMAIESLPLWSDEFEFIIRGPGAMEYIRFLRLRAKALGVGHRLTVEDPVNFDQIIPEANKADIGYFVQPDISLQKRYTLPNKFFEYIMSGLALCVSNLPEMSKIVRRYDLGVLVDGYSKESIAMSINSLTRESILQYKKNALDAAHDFCWDKESRTMMRAYNQITNKNEF